MITENWSGSRETVDGPAAGAVSVTVTVGSGVGSSVEGVEGVGSSLVGNGSPEGDDDEDGEGCTVSEYEPVPVSKGESEDIHVITATGTR